MWFQITKYRMWNKAEVIEAEATKSTQLNSEDKVESASKISIFKKLLLVLKNKFFLDILT